MCGGECVNYWDCEMWFGGFFGMYYGLYWRCWCVGVGGCGYYCYWWYWLFVFGVCWNVVGMYLLLWFIGDDWLFNVGRWFGMLKVGSWNYWYYVFWLYYVWNVRRVGFGVGENVEWSWMLGDCWRVL